MLVLLEKYFIIQYKWSSVLFFLSYFKDIIHSIFFHSILHSFTFFIFPSHTPSFVTSLFFPSTISPLPLLSLSLHFSSFFLFSVFLFRSLKLLVVNLLPPTFLSLVFYSRLQRPDIYYSRISRLHFSSIVFLFLLTALSFRMLIFASRQIRQRRRLLRESSRTVR